MEAFWGNSKISLGFDTPTAQDGTFTIKNLPDGPYTLTFNTPGYRLVEAPKDTVIIAKGKSVVLKDVTLIPGYVPALTGGRLYPS